MKIFHKIFLGMIFSAGLPLAVSGWWTTKLVKKENSERIFILLSSSAQNLADAISRYIKTSVNLVEASLKNLPIDEEYVLREVASAFENIHYISVNGKMIGDMSFSRKNYGDGIFLEDNAIVYSSGKLKVALSVEPVKKIIHSFSVGKTGSSSIRKLTKDTTSEILEISENGKRYISAYYRIENSDFGVYVMIEKNEVENLWKNILYQVLFWIGIGIILAFSSAFVITGGITTPLKRLSEVAREYARLNFSVKTIYKGSAKDEISDFTKAFSVMSDEIQRAWEEIKMWNTELEKRVEERTLQLKKTHDNLLISEKIAAVGTLGAGVAHEINNPLAASLGFIQILRKKVSDENLKKYFDSIFNNLQRVRGIVEKLRQFSEVQMKADYKLINVNEVIKIAIDEIPEELKTSKELEISSQEVPEIYSNEEQFKTAIYEILKNAYIASESKVKIRVYSDNNSLFVEIEDDGKEGIPQDIITRIFDPFFTLKKWEGVGLGLTVARTIIQNIRGIIEVESSPGKTIFKISVDLQKNREIGEFLKEEIDKIKAHLV